MLLEIGNYKVIAITSLNDEYLEFPVNYSPAIGFIWIEVGLFGAGNLVIWEMFDS
jgi:hypothetical protein